MTTQTSQRTASTLKSIWKVFFKNVYGKIMDWGKQKLLFCCGERIGRFKCCEIVIAKIMIFIVQCNTMVLSFFTQCWKQLLDIITLLLILLSFPNHIFINLCAKEDNHKWANNDKSQVWNHHIASSFKQKIKVMGCWLNWGMKRPSLQTWALLQDIQLISSCCVMRN